MANVKVICRLPHGLVINHPVTRQKVVLNGANKDPRMSKMFAIFDGEFYGTTLVDAEFWAAWSESNKLSKVLQNNAIYIAKDDASAQSKAKELKSEKTGFEGMPKTAKKIKPSKDE